MKTPVHRLAGSPATRPLTSPTAAYPSYGSARCTRSNPLVRLAALALSASLISACSSTPTPPPVPPTPTPVVQPTSQSGSEVYNTRRTSVVLVKVKLPATPWSEAGEGTGSGAVIEIAGERYILTAAHVVEGATTIAVRAAGGAQDRPARVVGISSCDDVALLKVDNFEGMEVAPFGKSAGLTIGAPLYLIGYPLQITLGTAEPSLSEGVVSQLSIAFRHLLNVIQHDAESDGGYSGGPIFNDQGAIVGIHVMRFAQGARFAVSGDYAQTLLGRLAGGETMHNLGLTLEEVELQDGSSGVVIVGVEPGGPADRARLQLGDVLIGLEQIEVDEKADLCGVLRSRADGKSVRLNVARPTEGDPLFLEGVLTINDPQGVNEIAPVEGGGGTDEGGGGTGQGADEGTGSMIASGPFTPEEIQAASALSRRVFEGSRQLLFDSFQEEESKVRWWQEDTAEQASRLRNNVYELTLKRPDTSAWWWWWSGEANAWPRLGGTYMLEVDVAMPNAPNGGAGIAFAIQDGGDGATFVAYGDGHWSLTTWVGGSTAKAYTTGRIPNSAIRGGGQVNQLRVLREGDTVFFFVNDTLVAAAADFPLPDGYVGVAAAVAGSPAPATVVVDNFHVRQVQ